MDNEHGSIIVDTEIDAAGFKAGSEKLLSAIGSLGKSMDKIGKQVRDMEGSYAKALSGGSSAVRSFYEKVFKVDNAFEDLEKELYSVEDELIRLGNSPVQLCFRIS